MRNIILVCPRFDVEGYLITELATKSGLRVITPPDPKIKSLDEEPRLLDEIMASNKPHVVIVRLPSPITEDYLTGHGKEVTIIDHRDYPHMRMDRSYHPETGAQLPSSLEQFIAFMGWTDEQLDYHQHPPKIIRAVTDVMDTGYAQQLRQRGYTQDEIASLLNLLWRLHTAINPHLEKHMQAAEEAWRERQSIRDAEGREYHLAISQEEYVIDYAVGILAIQDQRELEPRIVVELGERKIILHNLDPLVAARLVRVSGDLIFKPRPGNRFVVYNDKSEDERFSLEEVLAVLGLKR